MQQKGKEKSQLVMCGSRALTNEQANYETAELEALAVLYACQACRHQLHSVDKFEVRSTYRPLQGPFQRKMHEMDNARILRIREKLAEYRFNIEWAYGKQNKLAKTLCRDPTFQTIEEELTISAATQCLAAITTLESLIHNNEEYATLRANLQNTNAPPKNKTTAPFKKIWSDLSIADNGFILLKAGRIVIPNNKKEDILRSLHS